MQSNYSITGVQAAILQILGRQSELALSEIIVYGRLLPEEALAAVNALEQARLVSSYRPVTGRTAQRIVQLTGEGQTLARTLGQYKSVPEPGMVISTPTGFSGWLGLGGAKIEIVRK